MRANEFKVAKQLDLTPVWSMCEGVGEIPSYAAEASEIQFDGRAVNCPDCGEAVSGFTPQREGGEVISHAAACRVCRAILTIFND